jgi:hypothetical protein
MHLPMVSEKMLKYLKLMGQALTSGIPLTSTNEIVYYLQEYLKIPNLHVCCSRNSSISAQL